MLYRSNHLFNLNQQAVNYISHLGINSIIDYRTKMKLINRLIAMLVKRKLITLMQRLKLLN